MVPTRTYNVRPLRAAEGKVAERFTFGWRKPSPRDAEETGRKRPATPVRARARHRGSPAALRLLSRVVSPWSLPERTTFGHLEGRGKVAERFTFGWRKPSPRHAEETGRKRPATPGGLTRQRFVSSAGWFHHGPHPNVQRSATWRFHPQRFVSSAGWFHRGPYPNVQRSATWRSHRQRFVSSAGWFHRGPYPNVQRSATWRFHPQRSVSSAGWFHRGPYPNVQRSATGRSHRQRFVSSAGWFHLGPHPNVQRSATGRFHRQRSVSSGGWFHLRPYPDVQRPARSRTSAMWQSRLPDSTGRIQLHHANSTVSHPRVDPLQCIHAWR